MSTDQEWEKWGKNDPYFGVLTDDKFRNKNFDEAAKIKFFESGEIDIKHVLEVIYTHIDSAFSPQKALDFGCGTGRLVIPLAKLATKVVGVDVSESMLKEAALNCRERSIENVRFIKSDDSLSSIHESFDFIHSYIVLQHIPTARGKKIFQNLLSRLEENGIGAIQLTYASSTFFGNAGPVMNLLKRLLRKPKRYVKKLLFGQKDPGIEMNKYNLNELFVILQNEGIRDFHVEYTNHGGELGVYLYFRKRKNTAI